MSAIFSGQLNCNHLGVLWKDYLRTSVADKPVLLERSALFAKFLYQKLLGYLIALSWDLLMLLW